VHSKSRIPQRLSSPARREIGASILGAARVLVPSAIVAARRLVGANLQKMVGRQAKTILALTRLHEAASRLWLSRDLDQALDDILRGAIELLGADKGNIQVLDSKRGTLKIVASRGFDQDFLDFFSEVSAADDSVCGRALRSGKRLVVEDVESDAAFALLRPAARKADFRAVQSTPIMSRGGVPLGMLSTHFRSVHHSTEGDLLLLDLYVRQLGDIIERHKVDDALRESEERLRLVQYGASTGIWELDLRTDKLVWTPQLEAIFGLAPGSVKVYADFRDRVHPDDIEQLEAGRDAAVRRREPFRLEFRVIRSDAQIRWMLVVGGASYDEVTGEPVRILGNTVDITERKQTELALAERNLQFALAGKAGLIGRYTYDVETDLKQISPGFAAIHGLPEGTTEIARSDWLAIMHPEDAERIQLHRSEAFREHQTEYKEEYRISRPTGEIRWIELRSFISYDTSGCVGRVVGVNIDITERKHVEEHRDVLIAELDHRVKNIFATVSAVVAQTRNKASPADFAATVRSRINSLARTHELLSNGRWSGASLRAIIERELAPYTAGNATLRGPSITLKKEAVQVVSMVLHELATNAAKYGALSNQNGRVSVRWFWLPDEVSPDRLAIIWRESDGPPVSAPSDSGYGTTIIRELLPHELGGTVDLAYPRDGVLCRLEVPAEWVNKTIVDLNTNYYQATPTKDS
jgi:PAS domain S-box-containing protein